LPVHQRAGTIGARRHKAVTVPEPVGVLDGLVARVLDQYPYRFTLPLTPDDRQVAFRVRAAAAVASGWRSASDLPDGLEQDSFDTAAVQVVGWDDGVAVCAGRLVLPPGPLPTEVACDIVVRPHHRVVDVGRMCVAPSYQSYRHAAFVALLCRLYLEMRSRGYEVACGMMSPRVRTLIGQLGVRVQQLGADRDYWGEVRAPVRFELMANTRTLQRRWT
jgi:hypothetical protein